ncbi:PilZ domain-containing protein [Mariprofundus sp. EBB-1]|uniref:PilZ domain-containing protein n=1 Tax=Mariprofundus sp. EBB-1 TaxID=2650971 RepID=UPI000EF1E2A4|nr:PilZ domain-containing protein [Mariprofundus sp. EBB-1]RLL55026.1 PilZ domain-containing protein [Mariprofundus sp. EBB-1]
MKLVSDNIIETLTDIAQQLPDEKKQQLLDLLATWTPDVRNATRESYTELLNFESKSGSHFGHARDISSTGLFIETPADFDVGESVNLLLTFISAPNPLKLTGTVVRKTDVGIGIQFDETSQSQVNNLDSIISNHILILRQIR